MCEAKQKDSHSPVTCTTNEEACNCAGLASTEVYNVQVTACARSNDCSPPSTTQATTLPESMHIYLNFHSINEIECCHFTLFSEPQNLTVLARTNDSLTLTWLSSSKGNSILFHAATLKHIGESQPLKTLKITTNMPCEATFEQLLAYTQFRIAVRACTSVHDCGDAADFDVSTLPSGKLYTLLLKKLFETTFP